jgi:hypothetical protein
MGASIVRDQAGVGDEAAMARLLRSVPEPALIRSLIAKGGHFFHQAWSRENKVDFWFSCNGKILVCFAIGGLTVQQAASVRRWWHTISDGRADRAADQEGIIDIVEAVTGQKLTL